MINTLMASCSKVGVVFWFSSFPARRQSYSQATSELTLKKGFRLKEKVVYMKEVLELKEIFDGMDLRRTGFGVLRCSASLTRVVDLWGDPSSIPCREECTNDVSLHWRIAQGIRNLHDFETM